MQNQNASDPRVQPNIMTLFLLVSLASVSALLFTPALPLIQKTFSISTPTLQSTVSIFLLGYAFGQLLYGPLAAYFGRKRTLYFAMILSVFSALLCALSSPFHQFNLLLIGRLLNSIGSGAGLAVAFIIINDVYETQESRKIIALMTMSFAAMPGLSIFIGGLIVDHSQWEYCFYFLAIYYLLLLYLSYRLPETSRSYDKNALNPKKIMHAYLTIAKDLRFCFYSFKWGLATAGIYIFSATAPLIAINIMKLSPQEYGFFYLLASAGFSLGGLISHRSSHKISARTAVALGIGTFCTGVVAISLSEYYFSLNPRYFFLSAFVIYLGSPLILSNSSALAMQHIDDKANGSALMGFINMFTAVLGITAVGLLHDNPEFILSESFFIIACLLILTFFLSKKTVTIRIE